MCGSDANLYLFVAVHVSNFVSSGICPGPGAQYVNIAIAIYTNNIVCACALEDEYNN